ncbi:hypothetical protein ABZ027_38555 [Streptomyces sp. NPDC006332]|uniref:hypothetical protein n=1 Tax=Streptomyces sp. NPDC006332 TaxID=3155456 RepID=UPI0033B10237
MIPAISWDKEPARAWTVLGQLHRRQQEQHTASVATRLSLKKKYRRDWKAKMRARGVPLRPGEIPPDFLKLKQEYIEAREKTRCVTPFLLAFLFAQPDSEEIRTLAARGGYFDHRTGDTWDLFFPGYYISTSGSSFERQTGARPLCGPDDLARGENSGEWYFDPKAFNDLRRKVELQSDRRWKYSGETDLVLVNGYMPELGEITIDWSSTISGRIDHRDRTAGLTLSGAIERITGDLESKIEDQSYGVPEIVLPHLAAAEPSTMRDFVLNALAGIVSTLLSKAAGL